MAALDKITITDVEKVRVTAPKFFGPHLKQRHYDKPFTVRDIHIFTANGVFTIGLFADGMEAIRIEIDEQEHD